MGFLRTDYSNTGDFAPLPIGEYECFVSKVETTTTSTSKPMLKVTLTVRDDIEQPGQKRKFFDNMVEQENMMWKFNQVAKAAQLEEGVELETLEDFAAAIQYKPVRIKNKHEVYNGETNDRIAIWKESQYGGDFGSGVDGDPFSGGSSIEIGDDDLPF
jgi:predicted RNA-binding protein with PUA-like domain